MQLEKLAGAASWIRTSTPYLYFGPGTAHGLWYNLPRGKTAFGRRTEHGLLRTCYRESLRNNSLTRTYFELRTRVNIITCPSLITSSESRDDEKNRLQRETSERASERASEREVYSRESRFSSDDRFFEILDDEEAQPNIARFTHSRAAFLNTLSLRSKTGLIESRGDGNRAQHAHHLVALCTAATAINPQPEL